MNSIVIAIFGAIAGWIMFTLGYAIGRKAPIDRAWKEGYLACHKARMAYDDTRRCTNEEFTPDERDALKRDALIRQGARDIIELGLASYLARPTDSQHKTPTEY